MEKFGIKETSDAISDHNSLSRSLGNNYQRPNNTDEEASFGICNQNKKQKRKGLSRTQRKKQQSAAKRRSKARL